MAEFDILTYPGAASSFSGPEFGAIVSDKRKRFGGIEVEWIPGARSQPAKRTEGRADLKLSAKRKRIDEIPRRAGRSG
jgi:hypothetical protein